MKNFKALVAASLMITACSARGEDIEEHTFYDYPVSRPEVEPRTLAVLDVQDVTVTFTLVWTTRLQPADKAPLDTFSPSIVIQEDPDAAGPVEHVQDVAPIPPTSAEIYYALTGDEPPHSIREYHELEAFRLNRELGFVHIIVD